MNEKNENRQEWNIPFLSKEEDRKSPAPGKKKKKSFRIPAPAWFGIGCAVVLGALLIGWKVRTTVLGEEISLLDSASPSFAGYSGGGYLSADFAPEQSTVEALQKMADKRREQGKSTDDLERLISSISCDFEKTSGLKNNDTLVYACTYNAEAAEAARVRLKDVMKSYTVAGLPDYAVLDAFGGVSADWKLSSKGLDIGLNVPQELESMGISYSYTYDGDEYSGTVEITADYDETMLKSYGYVIENSTATYELGPKPEQITDLSQLSDDERSQLRTVVQEMLETELAKCGGQFTVNLFTGSRNIEIIGITDAYIEEAGLSYFNSSHAFKVTFTLEMGSVDIISSSPEFTASYTGRIYRMQDQSIHFLTNTVHACEFSGLFGYYSLSESEE